MTSVATYSYQPDSDLLSGYTIAAGGDALDVTRSYETRRHAPATTEPAVWHWTPAPYSSIFIPLSRFRSVGDPTGLVPVVKEVEWGRVQHPTSTLASTGTRLVGSMKLQALSRP